MKKNSIIYAATGFVAAGLVVTGIHALVTHVSNDLKDIGKGISSLHHQPSAWNCSSSVIGDQSASIGQSETHGRHNDQFLRIKIGQPVPNNHRPHGHSEINTPAPCTAP